MADLRPRPNLIIFMDSHVSDSSWRESLRDHHLDDVELPPIPDGPIVIPWFSMGTGASLPLVGAAFGMARLIDESAHDLYCHREEAGETISWIPPSPNRDEFDARLKAIEATIKNIREYYFDGGANA